MRNLHVVDSSIVRPLTIYPQFGVLVAAEKMSQLILGMGGKLIVRENSMKRPNESKKKSAVMVLNSP
jgi:hypothetical protein